jgi:hypothetical protein
MLHLRDNACVFSHDPKDSPFHAGELRQVFGQVECVDFAGEAIRKGLSVQAFLGSFDQAVPNSRTEDKPACGVGVLKLFPARKIQTEPSFLTAS